MTALVGFSDATLALLAAASFATSFLTAAFGLGGGLALIGILGGALPPAALIPAHGLIQLGSNAGRAAALARHMRRAGLAGFLLGATLGVVLGGAVAVAMPPAALRLALAGFILWSVFGRVPVLPGAAFPVGAVSSVLTMFFGATGPFVAAWVKTLRLDRMTHMATFSALMTAQHALKVAAFAVYGFDFEPWLGFCALMIGAGFIGTLAGNAVLMRGEEARFRLILNAILTLLALRLIWSVLSA